MKRIRSVLLAGCLAAAGFALLPARAAEAQQGAAVQMQPADAAAPKLGADGQVQPRFQMLHEQFLKRGKEGKIGVLFLGDSITEGWGGRGKEVWEQRYAKYDAANFGIGGDRTQH